MHDKIYNFKSYCIAVCARILKTMCYISSIMIKILEANFVTNVKQGSSNTYYVKLTNYYYQHPDSLLSISIYKTAILSKKV